MDNTTLLNYLKEQVNKNDLSLHLFGTPINYYKADDWRDSLIYMLASNIHNNDLFVQIAKRIKPENLSQNTNKKSIVNKVTIS